MGRAGPKSIRLLRFRDETARLENPGAEIRQPSLSVDFDPDRPEQSYSAVVSAQHRKEYGQFFTPEPIAELMIEWLFRRQPFTLLDPAVGPGVFVRGVRRRNDTCQVTALDIDSVALEALRRAEPRCARRTVLQQDFLTWDSDATFDAVVANPPYLRHHDLAYDFDIFAAVGQRCGVKLSRLTNAYGLFILEICRRLNTNGRATVIVPGEWLNANFGIPIKNFLLQNHLLSAIICFSHAESLFDNALTTACILFIEKSPDRNCDQVRCVFANNGSSTDELLGALDCDCPIPTKNLSVQHLSSGTLRSHKKWNSLLEFGPMHCRDGFVQLGELATTRRGVATGANQFFHVSQRTFCDAELSPHVAQRCIGRAADVKGFIFTETDYDRLQEHGRRVLLVSFAEPLSEADQRYILTGERIGLSTRYLLAARKPWYSMEQRAASAIWAAVFGRKELRFVWNAAGVRNLTTFHCVYPKNTDERQVMALVACLNSRLVQNLNRRQHRVYGGGLLKFEPKDLLDIEVPDLRRVPQATLDRLAELLVELDHLSRSSPTAGNALLDELDACVEAAGAEAAKLTY